MEGKVHRVKRERGGGERNDCICGSDVFEVLKRENARLREDLAASQQMFEDKV